MRAPTPLCELIGACSVLPSGITRLEALTCAEAQEPERQRRIAEMAGARPH